MRLSKCGAQHFRIEIGYELSKDLWGRGLASEAVEAIIHYGFKELGLQRIEALIEPPNRSSRRLVEKLGFVREGLLRNYEFTNKGFDDLYMYALLKTDIRNH
ncbi:GNAT family N-acetyltransferase [Alkalibacterium sp. MB6]|uniref:GNAT family N-acetyltransferase n=1 Tax=Alkalibacterium sp. MB6 TaxID=2081965 RepID=UPI00192A2CBA|nr:GNAT family protein [Alkalibacterium sp. MB6]